MIDEEGKIFACGGAPAIEAPRAAEAPDGPVPDDLSVIGFDGMDLVAQRFS